MVNTKDAIKLYKHLQAHDISVWLTGGWGIDALLGEQTRPHKDLDVLMLLDDVYKLCQLLAEDGYRLKQIWEENRWTTDSDQIQIPTAFVLRNPNSRELDAHAIRLDGQGNGVPVWEDPDDFIFSNQDLTTIGWIDGVAVKCITPEMQIRTHLGYQLPKEHQQDLALLHEKFGDDMPDTDLSTKFRE